MRSSWRTTTRACSPTITSSCSWPTAATWSRSSACSCVRRAERRGRSGVRGRARPGAAAGELCGELTWRRSRCSLWLHDGLGSASCSAAAITAGSRHPARRRHAALPPRAQAARRLPAGDARVAAAAGRRRAAAAAGASRGCRSRAPSSRPCPGSPPPARPCSTASTRCRRRSTSGAHLLTWIGGLGDHRPGARGAAAARRRRHAALQGPRRPGREGRAARAAHHRDREGAVDGVPRASPPRGVIALKLSPA